MAIDKAGNTEITAYNIGSLGSEPFSIYEALGDESYVDGPFDGIDVYKFSLTQKSTVKYLIQKYEPNGQRIESSIIVGISSVVPETSNYGSDITYGMFPGGMNIGVTFRGEPPYPDLATPIQDSPFSQTLPPGNYYISVGKSQPLWGFYYYDLKVAAYPATDFDIKISSDKNVIGISPELTYTVNLTNNSTQSATGVTTEVLLPKGVSFVRAALQPEPGSEVPDSIGQTRLKFTIPNDIAAKQQFSTQITTTVTGFSQPLDKLRDYLWNIDVKGSATATILGNNINSNTTSKSNQVDSSLGLAADLARNFSVNSKQKIEILAQNVQKVAFQNFVEKPLQTWQENLSERIQDLFDFDVNKVFPAIQSDTRKIEHLVNQNPLQFRQKVQDEGVAIAKEKANSLGEAAVKAYLPGAYQAFKSSGLSIDSDFLKYEKQIANGSVSLDVYLGKLEDIPTAALQSVLNRNAAPAKSWIDSTINNFSAQGSYAKTLPGYKVNVNLGYANVTQALSYDVGGAFSLGKGFQLGGSVKGQIGAGQSLPSGWLTLSRDTEQPQNNSPQNLHKLSPLGFTEEPNDKLQLLSTSEAFALTDSAVTASANQSDSLLAITQGNGASTTSLLSNDGLFLAFTSEASGLIEGDTNKVTDVFFRNLQTNKLERISISNSEAEANGESQGFAISADGRYVVFASNASNLVTNDTNDLRDIFIRDRQAATTKRISVANDKTQANGVSNLGAISADGRYIVYSSIASNLVAGDTNGNVDVFLHDQQSGTTELISIADGGIQGNSDSLSPSAAISADGRYVVFYSYASNLVANDTNGVADIFVRDRQAGTTKRISLGINGTEANEISLSPSISADGRYVVFSSLASNLVSGDTNETGDIFIYNLAVGTLERVSLTSDEAELDSNSSRPSISADGRYVVFSSLTSNLGVENPDSYSNIFLRDRLDGETKLISLPPSSQIDGDSRNASISADGSYIAFESSATNLVTGDTNNASDIFIYKQVIKNGELDSKPPTDLILSATSINENVAAGTVIGNFSTIDANKNDTFTYTLVSGTGFTDNDAFAIDSNSLKIKNSPDFEIKPSYNIRIRTTDKDGLFFEKPLTIQVNDLDIPTNITYSANNNIFTIEGEGNKAKLQFTLAGRSSNLVNELGAFKVDDEKGTINGIAPGSIGYVEAALERAKVVFSAISKLPVGFNQINSTSSIEFDSGDKLGFFLVRNSTVDSVRSGATPTSEILFFQSETQKVEVLGNGQFYLAWEDGKGNSIVDFNDLVVKAVATNQPIPLGASYQANPEGELIDLRDVTGQVKATFIVNREAAFNNYVIFYQVADANGSIDFDNNGTIDLRPGDTGYAKAAIQSRVAGLDLTVSNQGTATFTTNLNGGLLYAPLIISNGKPEELLDNNLNNDPDIYFGSSIANPGKFDHIRLLGNNTWGFEDLPLGGDRDYNDVVVQANFSRI